MAQVSATVGIKNSGFKRGLDELRGQAASWAGDIKSTIAGAFAFGAIASWFNGFTEGMARVKDLSDRLNESTDTIQRVGNAAKRSGSDLEFIVKNLTQMSLKAAESADKFDRVGISAAAFVNAGMEEKVIMLAQAYEDASGSQEKMAALMDLLGGKGQDMMILLSQGVESLNEQLNEVPTVSEAAVNAVAALDDAIDSFKQHSYEALGGIIDKLATVGAATVAVYRMITEGGSFSGNMQRIYEETANTDAAQNAKKGRKGDFTGGDPKAAADDQKKRAAAMQALDAEMLELARSRMTEEQKIADLKREQAEQSAISGDHSKTALERLEATKRVLEIQQQIESGQAAIEKKKQEEQSKAADKAQKSAEDAAKAEAAVAAEEGKQALAKMDPGSRIAELKKQQAALFAEADKQTKSGDREAAAKAKLEALQMNSQIDAAQKELDDKKTTGKPSVVSSSLAAIGGGGGVFISGGDPVLQENRRQTSLLQQIVRNTSLGREATTLGNPF